MASRRTPAVSRSSKRARARRVMSRKRRWWASNPARMERAVSLARRLSLGPGAAPGRASGVIGLPGALAVGAGDRPRTGLLELLLLRRPLERLGRDLAAGDRHLDLVEVAGPDERLVLDGGVAVAALEVELGFLKPRVGQHPLLAILPREVEHRGVERVEAGEGHELEAVAEARERLLEGGDRLLVEVPAPVERRRAVVRQELARELLVDPRGELARLAHVGLRGLAPDQVGVRRVGPSLLDGVLEAAAH